MVLPILTSLCNDSLPRPGNPSDGGSTLDSLTHTWLCLKSVHTAVVLHHDVSVAALSGWPTSNHQRWIGTGRVADRADTLEP